MSAPRIPDPRIITSADLQWLIDRINTFKRAYTSRGATHFKEVDTLLATVSTIDTKVKNESATAESLERFLEIRKEAFIELTQALEVNFNAYLNRADNNQFNYQAFPQSKGHEYHKMIASTLSAIYTDYPSIANYLNLNLSQVTDSLPQAARNSIQFDLSPAKLPYPQLVASPRTGVDMQQRIKNYSADQINWNAGKGMFYFHRQPSTVASEQNQGALSSPSDAIALLIESFKKELQEKKKNFENKALKSSKTSSYKDKKNSKAHLVNIILNACFQSSEPTVITAEIDRILKSPDFKPLLQSSSTTKSAFNSICSLFGAEGVKSDMRKLLEKYRELFAEIKPDRPKPSQESWKS